MKLADFHFDLPDELIARRPAAQRTGSRLLELDGRDGSLHHRGFDQLPGLLRRGDLLVFNDTRVIPARLFGCKTASGGGVEMLIERVLDGGCVLAQARASKALRAGSEISLLDDEGREHVRVRVLGRDDGMYRIAFPPGAAPLDVMRAIGHMPLPPYIDRADEAGDQERYQTVYAAKDGAVAAPTAGLHFDAALLQTLADQGVESAFLTLHVGAGTFQPVRVATVEDHRMHGEFIAVDRVLCEQVNRAHAEGRRVIAVGTTSLRGLESAATAQGLQPCEGETRLFIYPGYRFRSVDALITNFHLPESTLLLLVCAFAGRDHVLEAYRAAIAARYRFYSYGDAMFIHAARQPRLKAERDGA